MTGLFAALEAICLVLSFALLRPGRAASIRSLIRLQAVVAALALLASAAFPPLPPAAPAAISAQVAGAAAATQPATVAVAAPQPATVPGAVPATGGGAALPLARVLAALLLLATAWRGVPPLDEAAAHPAGRAARSDLLATGPLVAAGLVLTALAVLVVTAPPGAAGAVVRRAATPGARDILAVGIAIPLLSLLGLFLPGDETRRAIRLLPLGTGLALLAASLPHAAPSMLLAPVLVMPCLVLAAAAIVRRAAMLPEPGA